MWILLGAAAALALSVGVVTNLFLHGDPSDTAAGDVDVQEVLAVRLPDLAGKETSLAQWKGKVLVVNFWATWCAPCREEIPDLVRMQSEFAAQGVQFVGVAADQPDKVARFVDDFHVNYPQLIGNYAALDLAKRAGDREQALPYTIAFDRQGKIIYRKLGLVDISKLRGILVELH